MTTWTASESARSSRPLEPISKGMIAERQGVDMEQAFATLRSHAKSHDRRLAQVATAIIEGALPVRNLEALPAPKRS
jgi:hypothetical protein